MEIKLWKREPRDKFTMMDVPSYKAVSVIEMNGGRVTATVSRGGEIEYWTVEMLTERIDETLKILRELKEKGMDFDNEDTNTSLPNWR